VPDRRAILRRLLFALPPVAGRDARHTLVCVFLRGGADTLNLYPPWADDAYHRARPTLALKAPGGGSGAALRLDERFGLHPAMAALLPAFREGRLALVQGVGSDNTTGSHFECQDQIEHGDAMGRRPAGGGWLGRFLRVRAGDHSSPLSAVAIGTKLPESLRGAPAVSVLESLADISIRTPGGDPETVAKALHTLYGAELTLLGERGVQTLDLFRKVAQLDAAALPPAHDARYPDHPFGRGLRELARLVKARVGLEIACIDLDGWDTHFLQGAAEGSHAANARTLAEGLAAFELDLLEQRHEVTVLVVTEFGRRMYENASLGTDHGRGFALCALGGRVRGGRILGPWPLAALDERNPLGPGGLAVVHDFRAVFAEVLGGVMGLTPSDAQRVFPDCDLRPCGLWREA
jgi:uncharacterized protein (DUF1501 family)